MVEVSEIFFCGGQFTVIIFGVIPGGEKICRLIQSPWQVVNATNSIIFVCNNDIQEALQGKLGFPFLGLACAGLPPPAKSHMAAFHSLNRDQSRAQPQSKSQQPAYL